jgi:hypothetical protein
MTQELGLLLHEGALAELDIEAVLAEKGKDGSKVL